jgi:RNA polymerase sigma factor (sigma-70 family)
MATSRLGKVLRHLRGVLDDATDAQLLERFLAGRDEQAFEALVRRHGPMVLGVCARVLGNAHDAEDAFQATFLVLARRAGSVRKRGAVGSWLYGVARHMALRAQKAAARRRAKEARAMPRTEPRTDDLREVLDLELERLPEKYRAPLVLCDLEGRTRAEAARQLGLPQGTVASRLARGRSLLTRRLSRHGPLLSAPVLALALSEVASAVPAPLVSSTVQAAVLVGAGQVAAVATSAAALMKEVQKAMFLAKLKFVLAGVMVTVALGASGFVYRASGEAAPAARKSANELEALRRENDLLKLNLEVVLEKVRALDAEVRGLRAQREAKAAGPGVGAVFADLDNDGWLDLAVVKEGQFKVIRTDRPLPWWEVQGRESDPAQQAEAALKAFREARDKEAKRRAMEALDKAMKKLRGQMQPEKK